MNSLMIFLGEIGVPQILLILAIILLLFGGKKLPELMRGLGSGIKEFKNAAKDESAKKDPVSTDPIDPTAPAPTVHKEDSAR